MLLVVDVGNSQTSFGIFTGDQLKFHWRWETTARRTPDEYAAFLHPLLSLAGYRFSDVSGFAFCSVVPTQDLQLVRFCEQYLSVKPFSVHSDLHFEFKIRVDDPSKVGADRLANAAYAVRHLTLPAIIVDLGTATTFDVITPGAYFDGGLILPGVVLSFQALSSGTSKLPLASIEFPEKVIGRNTVNCIQSGILFGYCEQIDGLLRRCEKELGAKCDIVITGGLASQFQGRLEHLAKLLPDLTLQGTRIVYEGQ